MVGRFYALPVARVLDGLTEEDAERIADAVDVRVAQMGSTDPLEQAAATAWLLARVDTQTPSTIDLVCAAARDVLFDIAGERGWDDWRATQTQSAFEQGLRERDAALGSA